MVSTHSGPLQLEYIRGSSSSQIMNFRKTRLLKIGMHATLLKQGFTYLSRSLDNEISLTFTVKIVVANVFHLTTYICVLC